MKNQEGRILDMYSTEIKLNDSVISPEHKIIGKVIEFKEDGTVLVEELFKVAPLSNNEVQLLCLAEYTFHTFKSEELITRNTRPFNNVYR